MGIYDREYARREGPGFLGSWTDHGTVCKWIIGLTVSIFIANLLTTNTNREPWGPITSALGLSLERVLSGEAWRLVTYAFVQDPRDIWPIVFNMLFLWWFGRDLEDLYGPRELLAFYLTASAVGGVAYVLSSLAGLPHLGGFFYTGSGAPVAAILTLCAVHFPNRIIRLFFILPVPIWLMVVLMIGFDAFQFLSMGRSAVVAITLSAALFALAYGKLQWRLSSWRLSLPSWRRATRPRLRVYREEDAAPVSVPAGLHPEEEQLEAKIDAILEKISRVGKENLTESERELLLRASEVFRRRRS